MVVHDGRRTGNLLGKFTQVWQRCCGGDCGAVRTTIVDSAGRCSAGGVRRRFGLRDGCGVHVCVPERMMIKHACQREPGREERKQFATCIIRLLRMRGSGGRSGGSGGCLQRAAGGIRPPPKHSCTRLRGCMYRHSTGSGHALASGRQQLRPPQGANPRGPWQRRPRRSWHRSRRRQRQLCPAASLVPRLHACRQ